MKFSFFFTVIEFLFRFNERLILLAGFLLVLLGFISHLPWGTTFPKIKPTGSYYIYFYNNAIGAFNKANVLL